MTRILPFLLAILVSACVVAQSDGGAQTQCSVSGTVTDSASGQPIKGAEVIVRTLTVRMGLPLRPASTTSDAKGEFAIQTLAPGRYAVRAFHDGYIFQGPPTILTLSPGQHLENIAVALTPGGVVSGHVVDETGKPLAGTSVELMKYTFMRGKRDLSVVSSTSTNKTGEYRVEGLPSGQYFLRASIPSSGRTKVSREGKVYAPVYFPNANDLTRSTPLELKPAQELAGMDLNMVAVRGFAVSGQVVDTRTSRPKVGAEVTLLSDEGYTTLPGGQTTTDQKGNFEFPGVASGTYVLVAQPASDDLDARTFWGQLTLNVEEANLSDIKLTVSDGQTVTGHLHVDPNISAEIGKITVNLESQQPSAVANLLPEVGTTSVSGQGEFRLQNVPEGTYTLTCSPLPQGTYLKSLGAGDVLESGLVVGKGQAPPLDLILSAATARVDGTVSESDALAVGVSVVLVPEGKRRTQFAMYRTAISDKSGNFSLRGIPPGDYEIFAWDGIERREFMNPDFLRRFENQGKSLHLDDGSKENLQLEAIPVTE